MREIGPYNIGGSGLSLASQSAALQPFQTFEKFHHSVHEDHSVHTQNVDRREGHDAGKVFPSGGKK